MASPVDGISTKRGGSSGQDSAVSSLSPHLGQFCAPSAVARDAPRARNRWATLDRAAPPGEARSGVVTGGRVLTGRFDAVPPPPNFRPPVIPDSLEEARLLWRGVAQRLARLAPPPVCEHPIVVTCDLPPDAVLLVNGGLEIPADQLAKIPGITGYEIRMLNLSLNTARPGTHVMYITAAPADQHLAAIVRYYAELAGRSPLAAPGGSVEDRLSRIAVYASGDNRTVRSTSEKVLQHPTMMADIYRDLCRRAAGGGRRAAGVTCYQTSIAQRQIAEGLGLRLTEVDPTPANLFWGTKTGSRTAFRDAGVEHPAGSYTAYREPAQLAAAIAEWLAPQPRPWPDLMIKLNDGISGMGNARLRLEALLAKHGASATSGDKLQALLVEVFPVALEYAAGESGSWAEYSHEMLRDGAIFEAYIQTPPGGHKDSPSVLSVVGEDGSVRVLATQTQILGGPTGERYEGCASPAPGGVREALVAAAQAVGRLLHERIGYRAHFGMDAVATRAADTGAIKVALVEINLRQGGTTHPYESVRLLTGGETVDGAFRDAMGPLCYEVNEYVHLAPGTHAAWVIATIESAGLGFSAETHTGVVPHMLSISLQERGKMGLLAIGRSPDDANARLRAAQDALHAAQDALHAGDGLG